MRITTLTALAALATAPALADGDVAGVAVLATYADIAAAGYGDSLTTALALQGAVALLLTDPSGRTVAGRPRGLAVGPRPLSAGPRSIASETPSSTIGRAR